IRDRNVTGVQTCALPISALLQAADLGDGYDIERLRAADGPILKAALHSLIVPVRDAEEKYVSLLRFLVLRGEGALQLTPQVTYKIGRASGREGGEGWGGG